jgi:hypothetical protein
LFFSRRSTECFFATCRAAVRNFFFLEHRKSSACRIAQVFSRRSYNQGYFFSVASLSPNRGTVGATRNSAASHTAAEELVSSVCPEQLPSPREFSHPCRQPSSRHQHRSNIRWYRQRNSRSGHSRRHHFFSPLISLYYLVWNILT